MDQLTKYEQETVINFNAGEKNATIYTRDKAVIRKIDTLVIEFPEVYQCINETSIDKHRFNRMVGRYNDIYWVQMPNITPHVCCHTYCSNMAKSGMNPKTLQYLMGHSDISVTMNVYTHIGFDDAEEELKRMEEFRNAQAEIEKKTDAKAVSQKMFKVV